ncbi:MAG: protein translocase subunit SecD, partial [Lacunisphaera sp.]
MFRRNLWKFILSAALVLWSVFTLLPLKDQDFGAFVRKEASAKPAEFTALMTKVDERTKAPHKESVYMALKQIGSEDKIDLTQFFPHIRLEDSLKNIEKRNSILLDELLRESKSKLQLGLDLKGGVAVTLEVDPSVANSDNQQVRQQKLSKAIEIIGNRINGLGLTEPIIRPVGDNRIEIQLPGLSTKDNPDVIKSLQGAARLDFRMVNPTVRPPQPAPPGYEAMTLSEDDSSGKARDEELYVKLIPEMTGKGIADAGVRQDEYGRFSISLKFTSEGGKQFAQVTKDISEEGNRNGVLGRLAIVLDGKLYSAPTVKAEISGGNAEISGSFTQREAERQANALNNPLDLPLIVKEQYEVGPSLASDAVSSGITATVVGAAAIAAFMITFYTTGGIVAVLSLAINITIILGIMASLGATMTLPGLAGIVLTMGMAVDANILIFERMREELALGKSLSSANQGGFEKALTTILDAHFVQLIICAVMIWLGSGPIKGFGFTLLIGVLSTLFSVLITGHFIMEVWIDDLGLKKVKMRRMIHDLNVDFVKFGKPAAIGSVALVVFCLCFVAYKGDRIYGIDLAGGDQVTATFAQKIDIAKIRAVAEANHLGEINITYSSDLASGKEQLHFTTPYGKSEILFSALQKDYPSAGLDKIGTSQIGATIGKETLWRAVLAVGVSMLVILVYIAFRFEFGFGIGAMASTLHDILMNIGIFVLFGHQFSAPMVAAILCVAGYSINETVVVFDRIREELDVNPTGSLRDIINNAIRKVFARTVMTATTTFLAALSLYLFGSGELKDIAFCFLVGIVTSTFSAIFIAAQVFYWWHKG